MYGGYSSGSDLYASRAGYGQSDCCCCEQSGGFLGSGSAMAAAAGAALGLLIAAAIKAAMMRRRKRRHLTEGTSEMNRSNELTSELILQGR